MENENSTSAAERATAHTPGPWTLCKLTNNTDGMPDSLAVARENLVKRKKRGPAICLVSAVHSVTPEDEANARLIAAAPDLLAACELALLMLRDGLVPLLGEAFNDTDLDVLRAAIAKAQGGAS